ncbi:hypothetical protein [Jannaschia sp. R86511]|uniref:hypothetical protein n=1 Tax=Jannaschia sp. R86511 TaxID=3093853 RepID=UPI0036D40AC8
MKTFRAATLGVATALALTACASANPDGEGANVVEETSAAVASPATEETTAAPVEETQATEGTLSEEAAAEPSESAVGTRETPLSVGTRITMGDYEVAITEVNKDATQQNLDDNEFNEAPPEGTQYVLVSMEGTYVGSDSGDPGFDLSWKILGSDNNTFDSSWTPDDAPSDFFPSCTLDTMFDIGETFPDGNWTGNFCILMPSTQVEGGAIILENFLSMESERAFWALG